MVDQLDVAKTLFDRIDAHPAVVAWSRVHRGPPPSEIRILKERSRGVRKSAVYWLRGAGPDGSAVIAKMARREAATLETLVYCDLLPQTRADAPRFHGAVDDGTAFSWIFLEHVEGERYTPRRADHRRAAGAWLAELHAAAARAGLRDGLPDRGPDHFLTGLRRGTDAMVEAASYPEMTHEERRVAEALRASLDSLAAHWDDVVRTAALLPPTLVHGDLVRKNLLVRRRGHGLSAVAFDWEKAGWGAAAVDLAYGSESKRFAASPSLAEYGRVLRAGGVEADREAIERCAAIGTALRCISGIVWAASGLSAEWVHRPMAYMEVYARWLEQAMAVAGIGDAARATARHVRARDADELRTTVEEALSRRLGRDVTVTGLARRRSEHSSSYATEIVTVHLAGAEPLMVFLKDFAVAAWQKDLMPERRARELTVYRELLDGAGLGTPDYFGAVWDEERGRFWLLLEHVDGPQVKWCQFAEWLRAAAWLGRLHGRFAGDDRRLARTGFLIEHDAPFFHATAELARSAVSERAPALRMRLEAAVSGYPVLVDEMAALPRTLVHGGYRPQNIIRGRASGRPRICPTDWEEAAYGSRFYDFSYLSDGFDADRLALLWRAYREEAMRAGITVPPDAIARRLVGAFNVHKNLGTLSKAAARGFPVEAIEKIVGMIEASAAAAHA